MALSITGCFCIALFILQSASIWHCFARRFKHVRILSEYKRQLRFQFFGSSFQKSGEMLLTFLYCFRPTFTTQAVLALNFLFMERSRAYNFPVLVVRHVFRVMKFTAIPNADEADVSPY